MLTIVLMFYYFNEYPYAMYVRPLLNEHLFVSGARRKCVEPTKEFVAQPN